MAVGETVKEGDEMMGVWACGRVGEPAWEELGGRAGRKSQRVGDGWDSGAHMGFPKLGASGLAVLPQVGPAAQQNWTRGGFKVELKLQRAF
jgi:hypothetical protein